MGFIYYIKKYLKMSRRQRKSELNSTIWFMPFWYIVGAIALSAFTYYLDYVVDVSLYLPIGIGFSGQTLQVLLSALVGGVLTLSAFTLNSLLVALTTFSGQFSSKMLVNFVSDRATQHVLGIFNGSFIYVLLNFLYVTHGEEEYVVATPVLSILTAITAAVTFIYFINHTATWMQVHNISFNMNVKSKSVQASLEKELNSYHLEKEVESESLPLESDGKVMKTSQSGYFQVADFAKLIKQANKDNCLLRFDVRIGEFVVEGTPLLTYWEYGQSINPERYVKSIEIGVKRTEIQDLEYGLMKLAEVAIKALGHNDPLTVTNTIHQIADLLKSIGQSTNFSPYLFDQEEELRVILNQKNFPYYLHKGFASIREYANQNSTVMTELLTMISLLSKTLDKDVHEDLWEFARQTILGFDNYSLYENDCLYILEQLSDLAKNTGNQEDYLFLLEYMLQRVSSKSASKVLNNPNKE
ncbi:putative membrane protein [Bacillus sp. es.036]|nr:putative membrane protein [Bacillus sp. es.036]